MTTDQVEDSDVTGEMSTERSRLVSVEIGEWPGLGGNVSLDISERTTVLVGRNGAGKSLLVEGIHGATKAALLNVRGVTEEAPGFYQCKMVRPNGAEYIYQYRLERTVAIDDADDEAKRFRRWSESCRLSGTDANVWTIENGKLMVGAKAPIAFGREGLVSAALLLDIEDFSYPDEAIELRDLFRGTHVVHAGVPRVVDTSRDIPERHDVVLVTDTALKEARAWRPMSGPWTRVAKLARDMVRMYQSHREDFEYFHDRLRHLGLVDELEIVLAEEPRSARSNAKKARRSYALVHFDGVNIGLCSDGTQRVSEIVLHLLQRDTKLLLIEEPEIAVHPSLLSKLLSLVEAHSRDRQVILSTHAPQIVDWCRPSDVRMVERIAGRTVVSRLGEDDLTRIRRYLLHEGTLSEYMYHRGDA